MSRQILLQPLTAEAFAPFGEVLEVRGAPDKIINQGLCGRHHDLADLDFGGGRAGISVFNAEPRALPFTLEMVERHPLGVQAFLPMHQNPYLVVVAPDDAGRPGPTLQPLHPRRRRRTPRARFRHGCRAARAGL